MYLKYLKIDLWVQNLLEIYSKEAIEKRHTHRDIHAPHRTKYAENNKIII